MGSNAECYLFISIDYSPENKGEIFCELLSLFPYGNSLSELIFL